MIDQKIENFLEKTDMNYLFCLLSKLETQRLSQLPVYVRHRFKDKITVLAMQHVAENEVPDYITEIAEAELAMAQQGSPFEDEEAGELGEETYDDSKKFIEELEQDQLENYEDEDDEEDEFFLDTEDSEDIEDNDDI